MSFRLVHLVTTLDTGGLENVVYDLARTVDRTRFEPRVLCLEAPGELAPRFSEAGIRVESLDDGARPLPARILRLARRLSTLRPDVLHTHNVKPHLHGTLAGLLAGTPVVINTKHGRNFPRTRLGRLVGRLVAPGCDRMVGVSDDAARLAVSVEGFPPERVAVIRNGVDLSLHRGPLASSPHGFQAIHVARLSPVKDQETLVRAAALVLASEPRFRLDIVGDGPARPALESLLSRQEGGGCVRLLGRRDDVPALLREADVFVLSSVSEGVSLTLLEAMAAGLPVVATRVGGNEEVVDDGVTGRLVPARDPSALAAAILSLLRDPPTRLRWAAAARRRVQQDFDLARVAARYSELYLSLLEARKPGSTASRQIQPTP